jgi:hypothetical protein
MRVFSLVTRAKVILLTNKTWYLSGRAKRVSRQTWLTTIELLFLMQNCVERNNFLARFLKLCSDCSWLWQDQLEFNDRNSMQLHSEEIAEKMLDIELLMTRVVSLKASFKYFKWHTCSLAKPWELLRHILSQMSWHRLMPWCLEKISRSQIPLNIRGLILVSFCRRPSPSSCESS